MSVVAGIFYCKKDGIVLIHKSSKAKEDNSSYKKHMVELAKDMGSCNATNDRIEEIEKKVNSITMMYDDFSKKMYSHDEQFGNLHKELSEIRRNLAELINICTPSREDDSIK